MDDLKGKYYLGGIFDPKKDEISGKKLLYDPDDLTTHAVVVGMTGSGKTGLCIDLLEEAALNNIPALMIDPKGDITNALLHFPDLLPEDFEPWVNPDEARRDNKTLQEAAEDTANLWKNGLQKWDIGRDRLQALKDSAHFAVYTPGSDAGIPISILSSLQAPQLAWDENREVILERISGTATALLGLVGFTDLDPVQSREHILLSNIFENTWKDEIDLDLSKLILQIQNPPFEKLGVFDVESFFPEKERFELAMRLNNILAAPGFQPWIEGQPLDIPSLLYGSDGKPRHSVFYIAHLSDTERMFFVTLLYAAVETWMRAQKGSPSLRAIVYFDEIFGYLPPVANPPSKTYMLRMLKQARAFGVAQVLVTQNPVDVDYKALSNAGTWMIGKLQTDRDKERLLDGLEGAAPGLDRRAYDQMISALDKRVFLLHNVHEDKPVLFHTRWAMNYLAGPLTRAQIPALNELAGVSVEKGKHQKARDVRGETDREGEDFGLERQPKLPSGLEEYFLPNNLTLSMAARTSPRALGSDTRELGIIYRPTLLVQAVTRYMKRTYNLDYEKTHTALVMELDVHGRVSWEEWLTGEIDPREMDRGPLPEARFAALDDALKDSSSLKSLETDFKDWIYYEGKIQVWAHEELDVFAGPGVPEEDFRKLVEEAARKEMEEEIDGEEERVDRKLDTIKDRLEREQRELEEDKTELSQRKMEEVGKLAENVIGLIGGRRRSLSTSLTKRRMTAKAKADVKESEEMIQKYELEIQELLEEQRETIREIEQKWEEFAANTTTIPVTPYKKDILINLFGVAWMPYYRVESGGRVVELPGFSAEDGE